MKRSSHEAGRQKQKVHNSMQRIVATRIRKLKRQRRVKDLFDLLGINYKFREVKSNG